MKILVTGGLGTIGRHLVRKLEDTGHEVWTCDLWHTDRQRFIRCDVRNYRELRTVFDSHEFEYVYHLAAEFGRQNGEEYYERLWMTNAVGTKNIVVIQEELRFRLVFFSSSEVYGDFSGLMSEDVMDNHAIRQLNDYAISKWVGELQVLNSSARNGTESVRVRLFNVYGPGEFYSPYRSANCVFCYRALMGLPYKVYTEHHRTSLYIEDAATTLANIVHGFNPGAVYNVGGQEYHNMKQVSDLALQYVNRDDSNVEYVATERWTTQNKRVDTTRAQTELGHDPQVRLNDGLRRTIDWMREAYKSSASNGRRQ